MTPEEQKALEEYKKKNAEAMAENAKIENLNKRCCRRGRMTKAGN